jgi:hypothetical protein
MVSDRPDATEHFGQAVSVGSLLNGAMPGRSSRSQLTAGAPGGSFSNEKLEVEDTQGWTEWKQTPSDHAPQPELDFQVSHFSSDPWRYSAQRQMLCETEFLKVMCFMTPCTSCSAHDDWHFLVSLRRRCLSCH